MNFSHLHVHTEYSLLDGFGTAAKYCKKAKELGQSYLACTDHGNVDGLIKFQSACDKQGIKPVLGCEAYIVPDASKKEKGEKRGHITLLVKNEIGWQNLLQMLTKANLEGMYYRPRIDFAMLRKHYEGLVILTGCSASFLNIDKSFALFEWLSETVSDDLYLEIMPHNMEGQKKINYNCMQLSKTYGSSLVATNDCHYVNAEDSKAHEVLLAIQTKAKWTDKNRYRFSIDGFHMRSAEEMSQTFRQFHGDIFTRREINEALETTIEIAEKCSSFRIPKKEICLPKVKECGYEDPGRFIWKLAEKKLLSFNWSTEKTNQYFERLSEEWELINAKKFAPYFVVVWELTKWCRENDIAVGPGRGSAGGSLLAYLLEITKIDPIEYRLLFSRFISEDRIDFPDIDIDFEDKKRYLVREHLEKIYGKNNISSLSTFMKMKSRTTVRDVGRVFDVPLTEVDAFAKIINDTNGELEEGETPISYAANKTDEGIKFAKKYPYIVEYSMKLEGLIRGGGQHASAVLVSGEPLTEGTRCSLVTRSNQIVSNWDMGDSEYVGLIKLDILGLNTMSVLNKVKQMVQKENPDFNFEKVPLNDPLVYEEISEGHTIGAFQLSAHTTTKYSKLIKPRNLNELSDTIALVRPGPLDSGETDEYIKRKHGQAGWKKLHPRYEAVLESTYGVMTYQEQIMEIIHKVGGLSYTTADKIRKVIGKKRDVKEFKPFEEAFIAGCKKEKTLSETEAIEFWANLQKCANYVFNRSHSVAYSIIGYWTMWAKVYYPKEFICASLTYGAEAKADELVGEAERLGLIIKTPRVGISQASEWVIKGNELYAPFSSIKGIGDKTALQCEKLGSSKIVSSNIGKFFKRRDDIPVKAEGKLDELLKAIGAYGEPPTGNIQEYFSFPVSDNKKTFVPNLMKILKGRNVLQEEIPRYCSLDIAKNNIKPLIVENKFTDYKVPLKKCQKCELYKECKAPVMPSAGTFNIAIVGEAPGEREDEAGKGLVGKSGVLTWSTLENYGLYREDFHVTNAGKCFPAKSKTPNKKQLLLCRSWLEEELHQLKPILILAFGNVGLATFTDKDKGITEMSGKTTWNEEFSCWICWCIHPAAVLRNPGSRQLFNDSIKNFADKIDLLAP